MKSLKSLLFVVFSFALAVHAQDSGVKSPDSSRTLDQKIDRMGNNIDDIHGQVQDLHEAVVASPLGNRSWGVEVDPVLILLSGDDLLLAGTVSNFSWDRSAEWAFPFLFEQLSSSSDYAFTIDSHYRYFMSGRQRGFYLSGFARFQHAHYQDVSDFFGDSTESHTLNRLGIGFELGGRVFSRKGIYWGWSASVGRYLVGNETQGDLPDLISLLGGSDVIFDVEFMKIGFAF